MFGRPTRYLREMARNPWAAVNKNSRRTFLPRACDIMGAPILIFRSSWIFIRLFAVTQVGKWAQIVHEWSIRAESAWQP